MCIFTEAAIVFGMLIATIMGLVVTALYSHPAPKYQLKDMMMMMMARYNLHIL